MRHFQSVYLTVYAGVASVCWYVLERLGFQAEIISFLAPLEDYLGLSIQSVRSYFVLIVLFALALLFRMSDLISRLLIERIPLISRGLRRILSGTSDIEGDWPLVVIDMGKRPENIADTNPNLLYLGFLRIDFKNGQYFVHGDDWNPDGSHAHSFCSVQSRYRDYKLQYWYEQGQSLHNPAMHGYTEMYFFPKYKYAERHAGSFLDPMHPDVRFYAKRRTKRGFLRRMRKAEDKIAAARELWTELEPKVTYLKQREICADFA